MRKLVLMAAVLMVPLALPAGASANAGTADRVDSSGNVTGVSETGWVGSSQGGRNQTTTQYRASYTDGLSGPVTCSGVNHTGKNIASARGRDTFTCTSTVGHLATNITVGQSGAWFSDFWALQDVAVFGTYTVTDTDGLTYWTGYATY